MHEFSETRRPKARSKWARVLMFSAQYKSSSEPLLRFIHRHGGLNPVCRGVHLPSARAKPSCHSVNEPSFKIADFDLCIEMMRPNLEITRQIAPVIAATHTPSIKTQLVFRSERRDFGAAAQLAIRDGSKRNNKRTEIASPSFNQRAIAPIGITPQENCKSVVGPATAS